MKNKIKYIRLLSDLHLEFRFYEPEFLSTDKESVLVLAGDIGTGRDDIAAFFIHEVADHFPHIIFVLGNHDYYYGNIQVRKQEIEKQLAELNVTNVQVVDEPELIEIDGYKFACGTFWTDFNENHDNTHDVVGRGLYDFRLVGNGSEVFTTRDAYDIHKRTLEKFSEWVDEGAIVVTHHMPSELCVAEKFSGWENYALNGGFRSHLDEFIMEKKPRYWLHGHGHNKVDVVLGKTRIVCNPRGYPVGFMGTENIEFNDVLLLPL